MHWEYARAEEIPEEIAEMKCTVFGHICPVVFVAERFTETSEIRRSGRYIQFQVKMRVIRRDNSTCQICGKHLLDGEVEFDHIIPVSKGGSSEENNIRLTCFKCNRDKNDLVEI
jgi:5-methylcytosine-specific restriction endonuclease McrA